MAAHLALTLSSVVGANCRCHSRRCPPILTGRRQDGTASAVVRSDNSTESPGGDPGSRRISVRCRSPLDSEDSPSLSRQINTNQLLFLHRTTRRRRRSGKRRQVTVARMVERIGRRAVSSERSWRRSRQWEPVRGEREARQAVPVGNRARATWRLRAASVLRSALCAQGSTIRSQR